MGLEEASLAALDAGDEGAASFRVVCESVGSGATKERATSEHTIPAPKNRTR